MAVIFSEPFFVGPRDVMTAYGNGAPQKETEAPLMMTSIARF